LRVLVDLQPSHVLR